jgi:hypothetical protein
MNGNLNTPEPAEIGNEEVPLKTIAEFQQSIATGIGGLSQTKEVSRANQFQVAMDHLDSNAEDYLDQLEKLSRAVWHSVLHDVRN